MARLRWAMALCCVTLLAATARAEEAPAPATPAEPGAAMPTPTAATPAAPSAPSSVAGSDAEPTTVAGVPMVDAAAQQGKGARYGLGLRGRWATVPKWLLGLFLKESVPLNSYTLGIEGFRRSGSFDLVVGVAWQALSPSDGNWLGKGSDKTPENDTDYVQFRGFGAVSVDVAFISRTELNPYVFLHYGGGIGLGITTGKMLRTSDGSPGCATSAGDPSKCFPIIANCPQGPCSESSLAASEGSQDTPGRGSRFQDHNIPAVYPIVNLITGLDFKIPGAGGLEAKLDIGYFFPYFFVGAGAGYQF